MIKAAREAGDLAEQGRPKTSDDTMFLRDYGISPDLAAYAVQLAEVPDDVWAAWHESDDEPPETLGAHCAEAVTPVPARSPVRPVPLGWYP
jgi:hypothetical protein